MQLADMLAGPVELVTFDLYETLVQMDPPGWVLFRRAVQEAGLDVDETVAIVASRAADDFHTEENGRWPIRDRSPEDVKAFRVEQARATLGAMHLPSDDATAESVLASFLRQLKEMPNRRWQMMDGVIEVLARLDEAGIKRAVISNADADVTAFCLEQGFGGHMDLIITSALVGWEKPDARPFLAALNELDVAPGRAVHIGDQPLSDVKGARAVGMGAVLLDRFDRHADEEHPAVRVRHLSELVQLVLEHNAFANV